MSPQVIVIGASAGGLDPVREVVSQLPRDFPTPVFVAMHIPAYAPSPLPEILSRAGSLPALHPEDHSKTEAGHIYVAPPDHHLLIDDGFVAVKRGPKENGFRPSIDALFRSAAYSYGPGAVGVVLSGSLNDGTSGLWSIKRLGGTAIIQEPNGAQYPSMPRSVLEYVEPDYQASPSAIGSLLLQLAQHEPSQAAASQQNAEEDIRRMAIESQIAAGIPLPEKTVLDLGELTPFTCPECLGTLVRITEGKLQRFRCHTGHGFTADALLEGMTELNTERLWQATRGYQEGTMLLEHMAQHFQEHGDEATARTFLAKSREFNRQALQLHDIILRQEQLSEGKLAQEPPSQASASRRQSKPK